MRGLSEQHWWTSPGLWLVLAAATTIPFFFTDVPPLVDLPNHIARYHVFLNFEHSPLLEKYYIVNWRLLGNLGVDIIVRAVGPYLGAEFATRIVVGMIPPLTVAGIYAVSRALSGQVTPSALASLLVIYNWPFNTGFVNFSLSAAMAMLILALWIRLRALGFLARLAIFAPLGFATWVAHIAGWGLLGLAIFGFELTRACRARGVNLRSLFAAAFATFPFSIMIIFIVFWRADAEVTVGAYFGVNFLLEKLVALVSLFHEEYLLWDLFCSLVFACLTVALYFAGGRMFVAAACVIAILYIAAFVASPATIFASYFVDRRILPYAAIFVLLSVGLADQVLADERRRRVVSFIAAAALALFIARLAVTTIVWEEFAHIGRQAVGAYGGHPAPEPRIYDADWELRKDLAAQRACELSASCDGSARYCHERLVSKRRK